jgi:hypothetical protein
MRALDGVIALGLLGASALACQHARVDADGDAGTRIECASCHMAEYRQTTDPVHVDVKPTACAVCHKQEGWRPSVIDHPWPLTGAHHKADCFACHKNLKPNSPRQKAGYGDRVPII